MDVADIAANWRHTNHVVDTAALASLQMQTRNQIKTLHQRRRPWRHWATPCRLLTHWTIQPRRMRTVLIHKLHFRCTRLTTVLDTTPTAATAQRWLIRTLARRRRRRERRATRVAGTTRRQTITRTLGSAPAYTHREQTMVRRQGMKPSKLTASWIC